MMPIPILKLTIRDAASKMANNELLLPAIQREYVWKKQAIELMFDSVLRGYPINTFMFWRITNINQQQLDFYSFLQPKYVYGQTRNTPYNKIGGSGVKMVVIDGQQRLTSLYIGLYGTYQTEKGHPMSLYLRLDAPANDVEKKYDFRFMTDAQHHKLDRQGEVWFKMSSLTASNYNIYRVYPNLASSNDEFVTDTMAVLHHLLDEDKYLNYYDISGNNSIDAVLDIFTRTNNAGTPLSKGDLLLSVLTTTWTHASNNTVNARDYVSDIIDDVKKIGYKIDRDWVIKCSLVLFSNNIKMRVGSFSSSQIGGQSLPLIIYNNRNKFKASILATFKHIKKMNLLEKGLASKLAVIPIVQYVYEKNPTINKASGGHSVINLNIQKWLFRAIVRNLFEAGTDDTLTKVKSIIIQFGTKSYFPYDEIEKQYNQLSITPQVIKDLLNTPKISAFPVLNIIFKDSIVSYEHYDMDHMHPEVSFKNLNSVSFSTIDDEKLAADGETFNTVKNLQLLTETENRSKNKGALSTWIAKYPNKDINKKKDEHCIPPNVSLQLADFKKFIDARSIILEQQLTNNL